MTEWHLSPDYIVNNWTDELLDLMLAKMVERKEAETRAITGGAPETGKVSEGLFFQQASNLIEVIRN